MSKRAIIVVDLQNDYLTSGKFPLVGIDAAVENAARIVEFATVLGCREYSHQFTICEELESIFHYLKTENELINGVKQNHNKFRLLSMSCSFLHDSSNWLKLLKYGMK